MRPVVSLLLAAALACPLACPLAGCSPTVRGSMALAAGDYDQALARYHEALRSDPGSVYLRQRIGLTYFAMRDYPRAEAMFGNVLLLSPGQPEALFYLGLSRIGKGEGQAGLEELTRLRWPFKFYHQQFVQEEARRLLNHPDTPPDEAIRCLQEALERGRQEQAQMERDMFRMSD